MALAKPKRRQRGVSRLYRMQSMAMAKAESRIRVATHGSGVGTVILALDSIPALSHRVVHQFASDDDPLVRQVLAYNYPDIKGHGDCTMHYAATSDLYFCISSCNSLGAHGSSSISELIAAGMEHIKAKRPSAFVLVSDACKCASQPPGNVLNLLNGIKGEDGLSAYATQWKVLDVGVYGGLPQSRSHAFVTGVLCTKGLRPFQWPRPMEALPLDSLLDCLPDPDPSELELGFQKIWAARHTPAESCVIDCQTSCARQRHVMGKGTSPCLTAGARYYFVTSRGRMMTTAEMMRLQGIHPMRLRLPHGVTEKQLAAMVRASVPVPLLARVSLNLCKAMGMVAKKAKAAQRSCSCIPFQPSCCLPCYYLHKRFSITKELGCPCPSGRCSRKRSWQSSERRHT